MLKGRFAVLLQARQWPNAYIVPQHESTGPRATGAAPACAGGKLYELAWLWLRHQPGSAVAQWFHERVGSSKGRMRRILLVAMARKLVIALWRFVTDGTVPSGAVLKASVRRGSPRADRDGAG